MSERSVNVPPPPEPGARKERSIVRNVVFALVPALAVALIGLLGGEVALRMQYAEIRKAIEAKAGTRERCTQASPDARRIYEGIPGKCGHNELGFRDAAHAFAKPAGAWRVVVIGDSVAMGQGVPADDGFVRVMERHLRDNGVAVEAILLAVTGYSTSQELALLDLAHRYQPDLIVWTYVLNDPADPVLDNANGELGVYFHRPTSYALDYLGKLWRRSVLRFKAGKCPDEFHLRVHCLYRDEIATNFDAIARSASTHGVPIMLFIIPVLADDAFGVYRFEAIHDDLQALAAKRGLNVIDARSAFAGMSSSDVRLPGDPWHPNARGHEILGTYLADRLRTTAARGPERKSGGQGRN